MSHTSLDIYKDKIFLGGPVSYTGRVLNNLQVKEYLICPKFGKEFPFREYYKLNIKKINPIVSD